MIATASSPVPAAPCHQRPGTRPTHQNNGSPKPAGRRAEWPPAVAFIPAPSGFFPSQAKHSTLARIRASCTSRPLQDLPPVHNFPPSPHSCIPLAPPPRLTHAAHNAVRRPPDRQQSLLEPAPARRPSWLCTAGKQTTQRRTLTAPPDAAQACPQIEPERRVHGVLARCKLTRAALQPSRTLQCCTRGCRMPLHRGAHETRRPTHAITPRCSAARRGVLRSCPAAAACGRGPRRPGRSASGTSRRPAAPSTSGC